VSASASRLAPTARHDAGMIVLYSRLQPDTRSPLSRTQNQARDGDQSVTHVERDISDARAPYPVLTFSVGTSVGKGGAPRARFHRIPLMMTPLPQTQTRRAARHRAPADHRDQRDAAGSRAAHHTGVAGRNALLRQKCANRPGHRAPQWPEQGRASAFAGRGTPRTSPERSWTLRSPRNDRKRCFRLREFLVRCSRAIAERSDQHDQGGWLKLSTRAAG